MPYLLNTDRMQGVTPKAPIAVMFVIYSSGCCPWYHTSSQVALCLAYRRTPCPHKLAPCCVQFDVTFPKMPCSWLSLDAMDISGEMHLDVVSSAQTASPTTAQNVCRLLDVCVSSAAVACAQP